jgi:hypothetical protein
MATLLVDRPIGDRRVWRSLGIRVLTVATLVAWAPLASLLAGAFLATVLGCSGDESAIPTCVVAGVDVGSLLYLLTFAGWLILGVWPLMLLTFAAWCGVLVWRIVHRLRSR